MIIRTLHSQGLRGLRGLNTKTSFLLAQLNVVALGRTYAGLFKCNSPCASCHDDRPAFAWWLCVSHRIGCLQGLFCTLPDLRNPAT